MSAPLTRNNRHDAAGVSFGRVLRAARAERGISLSEIEARTKIRAKFLSALEEERFADLPPYPFARGFLRVYAEAVGLDPDPLIDSLTAVMGAAQAESQAKPLEPVAVQAVAASRARRLMMSVGAVALLVLAGLAVFFAKQLSELSRPVNPESTVASPGQTTAPPPAASPPTSESAPGITESPPPAVVDVTPGAAPAQPPAAQPQEPGVTMEVRAFGRSWMRVVADGQTLFADFVSAGETRKWQSRGPMTVRLGNAGAVRVIVNGKLLGVLGQPGEVVSRTFSKDDIR